MKIVQLITGSASFGGAEAHVRDLAIGLRARGHHCIVMVGPPVGLLVEQLRAGDVPFVLLSALRKSVHPLRDSFSMLQVVQTLRELQPDVIATHTAKAGFIGRIAASLTGIPSFFTPHGWSFINRRTGRVVKSRLFLEKTALSLGAKVIAVCDAERRLGLEHLGIRENKISTIHHGLPDCNMPNRRRNTRVIITMVARFDHPKDHATLLQALSKLIHLDWELHLAGGGPLLPATKVLAAKLGVSSRVHFLDECSEIPHLLAESDIFTLISNSEAFPISILEAMRSGLPVVATGIEGVREAVHDGINGFLVPQRDPSFLADKMALLIASADLRARLGNQSRLRFREHFEWRAMLDKTEAIYAKAAGNAAIPRMASAASA